MCGFTATGSERMNTIAIEPIRDEHIVGYRDCVGSIAREKKFLPVKDSFPLEEVEAFVLGNIANGFTHFVAIDGGAVIGWCDIIPREPEFLRHVGRLGMGVLREYRGNGIGTALIRRALTHAKAAGLEKVELEVFASNTAAISLYEKHGFTREGLLRRAGKIGGIYDDVVIMGRMM